MNDKYSQEIIKETFEQFGMNDGEKITINDLMDEEGDNVDPNPNHLKFTSHQKEFSKICEKVNA